MTINELIAQLEYVRDELDNNTEQDTPARDCFWELNDIVAELNINGLDNSNHGVIH